MQLGVLGLDGLQLDGHLLAGVDVGGQVDVAEGTAADLPAQPVLSRDSNVHLAWGGGTENETISIYRSSMNFTNGKLTSPKLDKFRKRVLL